METMHSRILAAVLMVAASTTLGAQGRPRGAQERGVPGAELLLARTGELQLTDAQVLRLAAIARRGEARRASLRASMDSVRRAAPGTMRDSTARRQLAARLRADADRMREQERADRRDAIAVLTADQQARAWEMIVTRGARGGRERGMRRPDMVPARRGMRSSGRLRGEMRLGRQPDPAAHVRIAARSRVRWV